MSQVCRRCVQHSLSRVELLLGDLDEEVHDLLELERGALRLQEVAEEPREGRARGERHGLLGARDRVELCAEVLERLERRGLLGGLLRGHDGAGGRPLEVHEEGEAHQEADAGREAPAALHVLEEPGGDAGCAAEGDDREAHGVVVAEYP